MDYRQFLEEHLQAAGDVAMSYFGKVTATTKPGDNNQVLTDADVAVGKYLVNAVRTAYPDYNVIDEEAGIIDNRSRYTWVIDPIEATSNFAAGTSDWGIMIGLLDDATPIAGGIIAPMHNELYIGIKGHGSTCNGVQITCSNAAQLSQVSVSFSLGGHQDDRKLTLQECRQLAEVLLVARNMRNSDCEAVDAMYVARGSYGGRVNMTAKIWDNVAPQAICEAAGALWTAPDGSPLDYANPLQRVDSNFAFCTGSPTLHAQLLKQLASVDA